MVIDLSNPKHAVGLVSAVVLTLSVLYVLVKYGLPLTKRVGSASLGKFTELRKKLRRAPSPPPVPAGKRNVIAAITTVAAHFEAAGDAQTVAVLANLASRVMTTPTKVAE